MDGGGFGHHGPPWAAGQPPVTHLGGLPPFEPFLGATMFFLFLLLLAGTFFLLRSGRIGPPPWIAQHRSPEAEAKRILAERFARGEIASDEFMERASVLNWTPGSEIYDIRRPKKHRR
jgi:putative membrane protein